MKRKRLTIIFFTMMTLAVTPRVMTHFKIYADDIHQQVEAKWLRFLLGFGTPAATNDNLNTQTTAQPQAVCTKLAGDVVKTVTDKSQGNSKPGVRSLLSSNRTVEFTLTTTTSERTNASSETGPAELSIARKVNRAFSSPPVPPSNPVATNLGDRRKIEYLKTLIRSARLGDRRAVRRLEREFANVARATMHSFATVPAALEADGVRFFDRKPDDADRETPPTTLSSEDAMR